MTTTESSCVIQKVTSYEKVADIKASWKINFVFLFFSWTTSLLSTTYTPTSKTAEYSSKLQQAMALPRRVNYTFFETETN